MRKGLLAAALVLGLAAVPTGASADGVPRIVDTAPRASGWLAAPRVDAGCPTSVDTSRFATPDQLYAANGREAGFGARPTASPNHRRFIDYVARRLAANPDLKVDSIPYPIRRWTGKRTALTVRPAAGRGEKLRVAGPIPYSLATKRNGVAAPLVYVPPEKSINDADVRGKIVVRDPVNTSVQNVLLVALSWFLYDPALKISLDPVGTYERENLGGRVNDLLAANQKGAAGVIFLHDLPYEQIKGEYAPYEGVQWPVPAVFLGADEAARVKDLAQHGGSARITVRAEVKKATTRMLIATLPGLSDEKIVVQSHTDGMNAVWDNGPIAILAMADYFARIGKACRPRTIQFVFTTGHLYQHLVEPDRDGSAEQFAKKLDKEYDNGKVAEVLAMEHMGAREYKAVPRGDGKPGRHLVMSGKNETTSIFIGDSPALIAATLGSIVKNDVKETIALRGAELPGLQIPPEDNFGGEGNPYQHHLLPTVALVTAPWPLFTPGWRIEQLVDKTLLYKQTLAFTDLVHSTSTIPRELLGGGYIGYRAARMLTCGTALEVLGLVRHCY